MTAGVSGCVPAADGDAIPAVSIEAPRNPRTDFTFIAVRLPEV